MCTACLVCAAVFSCLIDSYTDTVALSTGGISGEYSHKSPIFKAHGYHAILIVQLWLIIV